MKYFKNAELARLYNVSEKSVRNWIEASQQGKTELELLLQNDKTYIADTLQNEHLIELLVARSRKYRNQLSHKHIELAQSFYDTYTHEQIVDIANQLELYHEVPLEYRYFGKGAAHWDAYLQKLYYANKQTTITATNSLLDYNYAYLNEIIDKYVHVNVIDLGSGNGMAARQLLQHLYKTKKLKRYIAVDVSKDLLAITAKNIYQWFDGTVQFETHTRNLKHERFNDLFQNTSYDSDASHTLNIALFFGGTITNFRNVGQVLDNIHDSLCKNSLFLTSLKVDSLASRKFFDFNAADTSELPLHHKNQLDTLSIDESMYEVEQAYDENQRRRYIRVKLKYATSIHFKSGAYKKVVHFEKGDTVLLLRAIHFTSNELADIYERHGFTNLKIDKTYDGEYLLMTSAIKEDLTTL